MRAAVLPFLLSVALSCSVKEERAGCPCYLVLDVDGIIAQGEYSEALVTVESAGGMVSQEKIRLRDYADGGYVVKVPRRKAFASVVCGTRNGSWHTDTLLVVENAEADPIRAFALARDCTGLDETTAEVRLHKQYCNVNFTVVGYEPGRTYPYRLELLADCNALRLFDLGPVDGSYTAEVSESHSGIFSVRVPRQKQDAGLRLSFYGNDPEAAPLDTQELLFSLDLAAMMKARGYDWTKEDLDDIYITVDFASASFELSVLPWDETGRMDLEI